MLADLVLNATASAAAIGTTASVPKLEGIGVGNGCLGTEVGACSAQGTKIDVDFLYGHGAISQPTYAALYAQCPDFTNPTLVCDDWLDTMSEEAGNYYAYNLYDDCGPNGQTSRHTHRTWREHNADRAATWGTLGPGNPTGTHDFGYPCGKQAGAAAWLNNAKVRVALHVYADFDVVLNHFSLVLSSTPPPPAPCSARTLLGAPCLSDRVPIGADQCLRSDATTNSGLQPPRGVLRPPVLAHHRDSVHSDRAIAGRHVPPDHPENQGPGVQRRPRPLRAVQRERGVDPRYSLPFGLVLGLFRVHSTCISPSGTGHSAHAGCHAFLSCLGMLILC